MNTQRLGTRNRRTRRTAITLLELVVASSLLAVVMTSLTLVLRTTRTTWQTNDTDFAAVQHAHAIVRHFVRQAREAKDVLLLTNNSVRLQLRDGNTKTWTFFSSGSGYDNVVMVEDGVSGQVYPLAYGIDKLSFRGYQSDGVTAAQGVDDVQVLEVAVTVRVPGRSNAPETATSKVWIRSW